MKDDDLKPCPFCGGTALTRSVNGGCLPPFLTKEIGESIYVNFKYYMTVYLYCDHCGATITGCAFSNNSPDLYDEAVKTTYKKWNNREVVR